MKCPNCVLGDLHFLMRGELRFETDDRGRPFGSADVRADAKRTWLVCDACDASFGVDGWRADGEGEVILSNSECFVEEPEAEFEPETRPPGNPRIE